MADQYYCNEEATDWSNLPSEVLELISERIKSAVDYISFRCVCTSWRSAAPRRHLLPLLASFTVDTSSLTSSFNFFIFTGAELVQIEHDLLSNSNSACNKLCCGSSHGWLILIDPTPRLTLFNPFTKHQIDLPPYSPFLPHEPPPTHLILLRWFCMCHKIILSSDPSLDPNFFVILMYGTHLVLCNRLGHTKKVKLPEEIFYKNADVIFYKGQLVFTDGYTKICTYSIRDDRFFAPILVSNLSNHFLVESNDDLLLVYIFCAWDFELKDGLFSSEVYKVVLGERRVVKVENLGDCALFVGHNLGISVRASEYLGCRANCIYFSEKDEQTLVRVCLEDASSERISGPLFRHYCPRPLASSIWLNTSLLPHHHLMV